MKFHPIPIESSNARWIKLEELLIPQAARANNSRGRLHPEPGHPFRSPFMRDRDRIVHSTAFRRLMNKTQVYVGPKVDHLRTRLVHTLEVAQIARTAARALGLNEDLTEAVALAHDLGHPPFGHAGERALNRLLHAHGGFEHNRHTLKRVMHLEQRYAFGGGINLTFEVLASIAGRIKDKQRPEVVDLRVDTPLWEAELVDECDSAAYDAHDVDDALQFGLIGLEDLEAIKLWKNATEAASHRAGRKLDSRSLARAGVASLVDLLAADVKSTIEHRLNSDPGAISPLEPAKKELEQFLFERVYRHPQVVSATKAAEAMLEKLFAKYSSNAGLLPEWTRQRLSVEPLEVVVGDYIAGMTDRYLFDQCVQHGIAG